MSFIPYSRQDVSNQDIDAVSKVLRSEFLTQGPVIPQFEQEFARRHLVAHAIAVSNATAGLHIACLALGITSGSRVWTSPISFVASANCALYCGADIDFVDIDPVTRNMSVAALREKLVVAKVAGELPDVVIPVDFSGMPCDLREIRLLADEYGFKIIEDASHATGADYLGRPVGSAFAHMSVFSFHAVKVITSGEGGMITTQDDEIAHRLKLLRSHGITRDILELEHEPDGSWYYEQQLLGFNYRMTEIQAALGLSQLLRLDDMRRRREAVVTRYDELLAELPIRLPATQSDRISAWHLYVIEIDESRTTKSRKEVFQYLRNADVGVNVHYKPIHTQPYYMRLGFQCGDYPLSERYYSRAITVPLFPALTEDQQQFIANSLFEALS